MSLQSLQRWWHCRLPASDTLTLTQRNIYILPTRAGWMLTATLVALLVGSINYQLNLGYLLTFVLAGSALAGIVLGHSTLRGLRLALAAPAPQFAGTGAVLTLTLTNERKSARHGLGLAVLEPDQPRRWTWCDVPAQGHTSVRIAFLPPRRGLHPVPLLTAETRFPMGAFRLWTVWRPAAQALVYPAPELDPPPLPTDLPHTGQVGPPRSRGGGDFEGVRAYRAGDPMRLVAWKKIAKAGELVSRDMHPGQRRQLWLDLSEAGGGDTEQRLSRLAAWVLQAEHSGLDYGLRVPGRTIEPDHGQAHQGRCLETLALC